MQASQHILSRTPKPRNMEDCGRNIEVVIEKVSDKTTDIYQYDECHQIFREEI